MNKVFFVSSMTLSNSSKILISIEFMLHHVMKNVRNGDTKIKKLLFVYLKKNHLLPE